MYHASEDNRLYNFTERIQVDVGLKIGNDNIDILSFLDDVSAWMEDHSDIMKDKYLPLSCVAVGLPPLQASAFMYGCFVGRAMEKKGITVKIKSSAIDKKVLTKKIKDSIDQQVNWFKTLRKQIDSAEKKEDDKDGKA